ncbi:ceramide synthase 4-like [Plasmopara halstedii]|uniref:Ceramide synthase 4-like n=1 Tax=Plasmopara halstedii TaxID=4781 RepID=A0A0P1AGF7_PLAHL|nr:ceramide synthase 4-like [Plasmopara halstedii]CEG39846.1 ceramide synthase 4-like [Plasmopara halstedii]|eukprot:XP_024576215.1 ceramide synthase 4-like [Plasmopara halstedii]
MPCFLTECDPAEEAKRFVMALGGLYLYHYLVDTVIIRPSVNFVLRKGWLTKDKKDKMRESLYKNAAVGAFHIYGLYVGWNESWFFNKQEYFTDFPYVANEAQRWYYMFYLSFWFQSIDFMLNITNKHYTVKRKDNAEMLLHHFATISLMLFSYSVDLTKIGICVLMLHDVNDLMLETAKIFVYLQWETVANILFGLFALLWFIVRWFFYSHNILHSAYAFAYRDIVASIMEAGTFHGFDAPVWYWVWAVFFGFLCLLLVLHIYWGFLIIKMVIKAVGDGNVEKDIRSDSEDEEKKEESIEPLDANIAGAAKPQRRRTPRAE